MALSDFNGDFFYTHKEGQHAVMQGMRLYIMCVQEDRQITSSLCTAREEILLTSLSCEAFCKKAFGLCPLGLHLDSDTPIICCLRQ